MLKLIKIKSKKAVMSNLVKMLIWIALFILLIIAATKITGIL